MSETEIPTARFLPGVLEIGQAGAWVDYKAVTVLKRFDSASRPWLCKLHPFRGQEQPEVILKPEDLAREACILAIASRFNLIWEAQNVQCCGVAVYVKSYRILPVGPDLGVVEAVPNAKTIEKLKRDCPSTSRRRDRVHHFLGGNDGKLSRLAATTAGLLAMSYIIGLADGHGDNYMITTEGEYFRIDFEHTFGEKPRGPDAPRLWLPRTVREALGKRLDEVIGAATEAVELLLGPNRNELLHSCQVMDVAFPDKESAVTYLASLSIEEFRREVHGVRSCALGKCMKSLGREKFYGKRHGRRHHASLNVMSPAALLCICRMHHVTTANQLVEFAEQLYGASALPRLVHFESSVSLLSRFNAEDMLTGLIESVMQVVSAIAVSTSMVKDLVKSLLDVVANAPTEHAFEEVLTEVAATMGMLDHDGPLTSEQAAELVQKATEQSTTEIGQWLHLHMSNEIWERLGDWLRLHMDSLSGFASVADDVLPWFPVMLGMKRAVVDKDIIGATLPVVVHWGLPGIMALVGAGPPCLLVSIALTSLCRMLPGFIRNQLLEGEMKKLGLQGIPDRGEIETAYWQFGHRFASSRLGQHDDFEAVSKAYIRIMAILGPA
ncbi:age-1 [Symbiodinium necroappetens]|uniref:Age-1 protein n=1 Tax=Symbiodinium necroappetens TaxID=1628268 RepID=A0A812U6C9_9DINO|nr:age-1 [Symbiodinium necroappetens]